MPTSSKPVSVAAPAKLNLTLHVTGRRADGYHQLDSLIAFADVHDTLTAAPAPGGSLTLDVRGPFGHAAPAGRDNIIVRAAEALSELTGHPCAAALTLTKRLPVAAGIGGGSADAAATLRALVGLWGVSPDAAALQALALNLGADVPVCLHGRAAQVSGIGEIMTPAPALPPAALVLVNPGVGLSTPAVFTARQGAFSPARPVPTAIADTAALAHALEDRGNDLTDPAIRLAPVVGDVLSALGGLPDNLTARMSGSGATCFGIFTSAAGAAAGAERLREAHPDWWVSAATLLGDTAALVPERTA